MEELDKTIQLRRKGGLVAFSLLFIVVSLTTFAATRLLFPIITYEGRTSLYVLPAYLTYITPLIFFYFILMSMYAQSIASRLKFILVLGLTTLSISLFNLIDIIFCIVLLWDGKVIVDMMTPFFPLDIILFNILYLGGAIAALMYRIIDKKYVLSVGVSRIPLKTSRKVAAGFYIPFASYFLGEFLFGIIYLFEGRVNPHWVNMIPHYIAFLLPAVFFFLYMMTRFQVKKETRHKYAMVSLIIINVSTLITFTWMYISVIINPLIIAESLQWEYELGLPLKYPFGMFITTIICLTVAIVANIKIIKMRRKDYEQKQKEIQ